MIREFYLEGSRFSITSDIYRVFEEKFFLVDIEDVYMIDAALKTTLKRLK